MVSVVIANFNGAAFLANAIGSACRQSLRTIEIIVSDDGSADRSLEIVRDLMAQDARIRLITADRNGGPGSARNNAIAIARGDWIAVLDSDDLMHPSRLETLVQAAVRDGADIVADDLLVFDTDHSDRPRTLLRGHWARTPFWVELVEYIRLNNFYGRGPFLGYLKPLFRASLLKNLPAAYDENLRTAEDYDLIVRLLYTAKPRFRVYPDLSYFYRRHDGSTSHRITRDVLQTLKAVDLLFLQCLADPSGRLSAALRARIRSIDRALVYDSLLDRIRHRDWNAVFRIGAADPGATLLLRLPIAARMYRLFHRVTPRRRVAVRQQVCVMSRQRVVGHTNGSSVYLLDLATAFAQRGVDLHFLSPSPTTLGRWPFLALSADMWPFRSIRVRGTWRLGRYLLSNDARRLFRAALAVSQKLLLNAGVLSKPFSRPAAYAIAQPLTRQDQLFIARHAPRVSDFLIADYCFLTEAFPYALRPDAGTAVIMHDRFSSRAHMFDALGATDSVVALTEEEECARLALADHIVAIQRDEAKFVWSRLPHHSIIIAPMAAHPVGGPQSGRNDLVLFVGSIAAANVDGIRWFLEACWPTIRLRRPDVTFCVAGTVCQNFGPAPPGVKFLGYVDDLAALYRDAGVIVSPLRLGSGLKIKLIEALAHGKALVATSATLQGVEIPLAGAVRIEDGPDEFASAVVGLLGDHDARGELAARGLKLVARQFSPQACYGPLVDIVTSSIDHSMHLPFLSDSLKRYDDTPL